MFFKYQLVSFASLAMFASAMPHAYSVEGTFDVDSDSLPDSGQIVFTPLSFGEDEFPFEREFSGEDEDVTNAIMEDWKQSVVRQHNLYRTQYGAPPLTWSDALYPATAQWAAQCKFQHSNGGGKYGENLAAGTGSSYGFSSGLKDWMDEASKYDYNHPGFSKGTGHFTQVVWRSSRQVACAVANCRAGTIFNQPSKNIVCRYSPPGNFAGRYAENVGRRVKY